MDEKKIEELKAQHGQVAIVSYKATEFDPAGEVVVRRPARAEWKRFRTMRLDDAEQPDALEMLARACIVYPDAADVQRLFDTRPALADAIGARVSDLAGGGASEAKKA